MTRYVEEVSRHVEQVGDIALILVIIELVYYLVKLVKLVYDWLKRRYVRKAVNEWRSYRRTRRIRLN